MNKQHVPLLEVRNLSLRFAGQARSAVDRVNFSIAPNKTLALVGGSGSGKSSIARLIMRLIEADSGEVLFRGDNLLTMGPGETRTFRQNAQIVFQEPSASLSPRRTVRQSLLEPLDHFAIGDVESRQHKILQTLSTVGLEADALQCYPHQFSSGQQQRIAIARALVTDPEFLIADEAVSSLDVSVQAQILDLLRTLKRDRGIALLFISHDLAVVRQIADQVAVMYRGRLLENSPAKTFFAEPAHPYSRSLLAFAGNQPPLASHDQWQLERGVVMGDDPAACVYLRDCPERMAVCEQVDPAAHHVRLEKQHVLSTHYVKCHLYDESQGNES